MDVRTNWFTPNQCSSVTVPDSVKKLKMKQKSAERLKEINKWIVKLNFNHIWKLDTQNVCLFGQHWLVKTGTEFENSALSLQLNLLMKVLLIAAVFFLFSFCSDLHDFIFTLRLQQLFSFTICYL